MRIVARCAPERIILFGSYATGQADEDSDLDLLVLFRDIPDPRQTATELYESVNGMELPKDIVTASVATYERYRDVANTIYYAVAQHGIVVYENGHRD